MLTAAIATSKFEASYEAPPADNTGPLGWDLAARFAVRENGLLQPASGERLSRRFFSAPRKAGCAIYMSKSNELKISPFTRQAE